MQNRIPEKILGDSTQIQQGIAMLLQDLEMELPIKSKLILGLISPENFTELNEAHADFFLNIFTNAHLSPRHEFTVLPDDLGRISWVSFITDQLALHYGTSEIDIPYEDKEKIYAEFLIYVQNFPRNQIEALDEITPISETTKQSLNNIVSE